MLPGLGHPVHILYRFWNDFQNTENLSTFLCSGQLAIRAIYQNKIAGFVVLKQTRTTALVSEAEVTFIIGIKSPKSFKPKTRLAHSHSIVPGGFDV
ncbi:hypothetical protein DFR46_1476 [Parasphingopyxis lamellibrachiae]|uniref:Uncharacterized protein n=1 Tax=Parasphingopyxis lamellibrachiae TaxID=680125 RepID=A0A3D9FFC6_9SPHN|nr:hypothetical protein DFR46_1476 [Parasphingopyxis lamellibrachiae]